MFMDYLEFAKKYDLDAEYVSVSLAVHSEVPKYADRSLSPFWLYEESKALNAILNDMYNDAQRAYKKSKALEEKFNELEKKLDEMGYCKC